MGTVEPKTGEQIIRGLLEEKQALEAVFTEDFLQELRRQTDDFIRSGKEAKDLPAELLNYAKDGHRLFNELTKKIVLQLHLRVDESMSIDIITLLLEVGRSEWRRFPLHASEFIANQLWGLQSAPFTQEEGLRYIENQLRTAEPEKGWEARVVQRPEDENPVLIIDTASARQDEVAFRRQINRLQQKIQDLPDLSDVIREIEKEFRR